MIDLGVIAIVMLGVTWAGHRLSGHIHDRRGFFQADGTMPLWAVSGSIIATVVSAVTFVSVPAAVFAPEGNLTYFQVILGLALGKVVVARLLARPFYLSQNLATSYEYIGARIDARTGQFSMALGLLLNTINAGVKLPDSQFGTRRDQRLGSGGLRCLHCKHQRTLGYLGRH